MGILGRIDNTKNNKEVTNMILLTDLVNFQWKSNFIFNIGKLIQRQVLSNKKYRLNLNLIKSFQT